MLESNNIEKLLTLLNKAEDELSTAKVIHNRQEQDEALQQVSDLFTELRTELLTIQATQERKGEQND